MGLQYRYGMANLLSVPETHESTRVGWNPIIDPSQNIGRKAEWRFMEVDGAKVTRRDVLVRLAGTEFVGRCQEQGNSSGNEIS